MTTIKITKTRDGAYDGYVDNELAISRSSLENILVWLADYTSENGPVAIIYKEH